MKLTRCDICGTEFNDRSPSIRLIVHDTVLHAVGKVPDEEWDMCEECGNAMLQTVRSIAKTEERIIIRPNKEDRK